MLWSVELTPNATRDLKAINKRFRHLLPKFKEIMETLERNPFEPIHSYEPLKWQPGHHSRRLDQANRIIYFVKEPRVVVVSCLGHYGDH